MSVDLIAAAQVQVTGGSPGSIAFKSNEGFKSASRGSAGSYELTLDHKHDAHKLVIGLTQNGLVDGSIAGSPSGSGDVDKIDIASFVGGVQADSSFYITVHRVR
jgi:hypothetical protein